ncbi:hypothetical protein OXX79_012225 [Metschnikowia pulcherrima]|uniref:Cation efflux protein transmembrane domain-containing protein n=1 Tax=Metschnikowia pulcherrima TaxID=27326 RepID=A0A8H7GYL1_9ASCO|nr:hypothetical protein HF325_000942 [Metschnikowia pulcherrima]KAJ8146435.1 hypothetical protein OY671_000465 [Metschnikowia pulcherrima]
MKAKEIRIITLLVIDIFFFLLEAIIGYTVHSLALIADSFHMLNDIISLFIALWAVRVKDSKPADGKYTYGWQRAEIIGALVNAVFLLALCFTIVIEAIQRFFDPPEISNPKLILIVGFFGLLSNGLGLVLFHEHGHSHGHSHGGGSADHSHGHSHASGSSDAQDEESNIESASYTERNGSSASISHYMPDAVVERYDERSNLVPGSSNDQKKKKKQKSMNMEGVFLHVLGDALGNVGVIVTALFIWKTDFSWRFYSDPVVSLFITLIIFSSALPLCRKSCKILLQATPQNLDSNLIVEEITLLPSIKAIHDFHVWNLDEDFLVASLHLELNEQTPDSNIHDTKGDGRIDKNAFVETVAQVREILFKFGVTSVTIQPEFGNKKVNSVYGVNKAPSCK